MRESVLGLLFLLGAGCSLTVRNPSACLFAGESVCPSGMTCDAQRNQCVPDPGSDGGVTTDGSPAPNDLGCLGSFCNASPPALATTQLLSIWGTSDSNLWAIVFPNQIYHWDGLRWALSLASGGPALYCISGLGANNLWVVGDQGTVFLGDGTIWKLQTAPTTQALYGVYVDKPGNVWVAGNQGQIYVGDGINWTASLNDPTYGNFLSLSGVDATHIWGVTHKGNVAAWDGSVWTQTSLNTASVLSISAQAAKNVWAAGTGSLVYRFDGTTWSQPMKLGTVNFPALNSIRAVDADTVYAVGDSGSIFKGYLGAWSQQPSPTTNTLRGIWTAPGQKTWVVGDNGTVLQQAAP